MKENHQITEALFAFAMTIIMISVAIARPLYLSTVQMVVLLNIVYVLGMLVGRQQIMKRADILLAQVDTFLDEIEGKPSKKSMQEIMTVDQWNKTRER